MFYTRINKIKIFNEEKKLKEQCNHRKIRIYTYVEPFNEKKQALTFSDLLPLTAKQRRQKLLDAVQAETSKFIQSCNLEIIGTNDHQTLLFGESGLIIYKNEQIPEKLIIQIWMIESDNGMYNFILDADTILDNDIFEELLSTVEIALTVTESVNNEAIDVKKTVLQLLRSNLNVDESDLTGYWQTSLSRTEHYPHGLCDRQDEAGITGVTGNMLVDYTLFGFENEASFSSTIASEMNLQQPFNAPLNATFSSWKGAVGGEEEFIRQIYPLAKYLYENRDGIHPLFLTAQAALEAGWKIKTPGNNIFGITKGASWTGEVNLLPTIEIFNTPDKTYVLPEKIVSLEQIAPEKYRYRVYRQFRVYTSLENSLEDYMSLLKASPYHKAWPYRHDPREYARQMAGMYTKNPDYAKTLIAVIDFVELKVKNYKL
ncbi:MAG: glucosaminidase domain-containing protein [Prevotellaceae bacterium]|jgi:flagellar protein FlgJ|nr:glucosaminidase domain-containing protein [Prevotellaceae bacterium]